MSDVDPVEVEVFIEIDTTRFAEAVEALGAAVETVLACRALQR